jgi:hypothetical protein
MTVCPYWRRTLALEPGRSPFNRRSGAQLQKVYDHGLVHGWEENSDWGLNVSSNGEKLLRAQFVRGEET